MNMSKQQKPKKQTPKQTKKNKTPKSKNQPKNKNRNRNQKGTKKQQRRTVGSSKWGETKKNKAHDDPVQQCTVECEDDKKFLNGMQLYIRRCKKQCRRTSFKNTQLARALEKDRWVDFDATATADGFAFVESKLHGKSNKRGRAKTVRGGNAAPSHSSSHSSSHSASPTPAATSSSTPTFAPPVVSSVSPAALMSNAGDMLGTALAAGAMERISNALGVDAGNLEQTKERLERLKNTLTDPEVIRSAVDVASGYGQIAVETGKKIAPLVKPIVDSLVGEGTKVVSKIADSGKTVVGNAIKEVPLVGMVAAAADDAVSVGSAGLEGMSAVYKIGDTLNKASNVVSRSFAEASNENRDLMNQANNAYNKLHELTSSTSDHPHSASPTQPSSVNDTSVNAHAHAETNANTTVPSITITNPVGHHNSVLSQIQKGSDILKSNMKTISSTAAKLSDDTHGK